MIDPIANKVVATWTIPAGGSPVMGASIATPAAPTTSDVTKAVDANEASGGADAPDPAGADEAPDPSEAVQASDTGSDTTGANDPSCTASVTAPERSGTESNENAALAPLAKVTPAAAAKAALATMPGTAGTPSLENENGNVVYAVSITTLTVIVDVKVDAGTGKVLAQDSGNEQTSN